MFLVIGGIQFASAAQTSSAVAYKNITIPEQDLNDESNPILYRYKIIAPKDRDVLISKETITIIRNGVSFEPVTMKVFSDAKFKKLIQKKTVSGIAVNSTKESLIYKLSPEIKIKAGKSVYVQVETTVGGSKDSAYITTGHKGLDSVTVSAGDAPISVSLTAPQSNSTLTIGKQAQISWITEGGGFDKYQIVVGNSIINSERQLYDKVSTVDYIPDYQTSFFWSIPDLLNDFAKGSSYSYDQIKNSFYLQVKLVKGDGAGDGYIASSNKIPFSVQAATTQIQPSLYITNPLEGHLWKLRDEKEFRWTTEGIEKNKKGYIEISNSNGEVFRIANDIKNTGSYFWTVGDLNGKEKITAGNYAVKIIMGTGDIVGPLIITN